MCRLPETYTPCDPLPVAIGISMRGEGFSHAYSASAGTGDQARSRAADATSYTPLSPGWLARAVEEATRPDICGVVVFVGRKVLTAWTEQG